MKAKWGYIVLNLVINGIPSIQSLKKKLLKSWLEVLNLVINGIPSILHIHNLHHDNDEAF